MSSDLIKISIIMPVYNVEKYILNSLESLSSQTYKNFELIVVDDGGTDKSIEIAENYLSNSSIKYEIIKQENAGLSTARNVGVTYANAELIVFVDSDDALSSIHLETLMKAYEQNYDPIVFTDFTHHANELDQNISLSNNRIERQDNVHAQKNFLLRKNKFIIVGALINKGFLFENEIIFNPEIKFSEDAQVIWQILFIASFVTFVNLKLYHYIIRENSIMTSSTLSKVLTGYEGLKELKMTSSDDYVKKYLLSRWVLSALKSSTKFLTYPEFKSLMTALDGKRNAKKLLLFKDIRVTILSLILIINKKFFYIVLK